MALRDLVSLDVALSMAAEAHTANDVLAATQQVQNAFGRPKGHALLHSVTVIDQDDQAQALDIVFMRSNVALGTEGAVVSIVDADALEILGVVSVAAADFADFIASQAATKAGLNIGLHADPASNDQALYVGVVTRGTPTPTAAGMTLRITLERL